MRCPECVKTNTRSSVRMVGGSSSDTFPALFWDGLGRSHMHTAEPGFVIYECAEGHRWREEEPPGCPVKDCEFNDRIKRARGAERPASDRSLYEHDWPRGF